MLSLRLIVCVAIVLAMATRVCGQCDPPKISVHPVSSAACDGSSVAFAVTATGTPPLAYQWQWNGVDIGGATAATYTINAATRADAGTYVVVVRNACGSINSVGAVLTVRVPPTITSQPSGITVCAGQPASFTVMANGTGSLAYRWQKDNVDIPGATSATYSKAVTDLSDVGTYGCIVTNACGSIQSSTVPLTVNVAPSIASQPSGATVCAGSPASFTVTATGTNPLRYQWRKNGVDLPGATATSFAIAATTAADEGNYDCVVANACSSVTSAMAALSVSSAPRITTDPVDVAACAGSMAALVVVADGTAPLAYQWRKSGTDIPGATSATYTIAPTQVADAGSYDCVVTNGCGSVTSATATLTIATALAITSHPGGATLCAGAPQVFAVTATGAPLAYQWRKNGVDIVGATGATHAIAATTPADSGNYDCVVTNACNSVTSNAALLAVNAPPTIVTQPQSNTVCAGATVALSVVATGTGNTYQWHKDFLPINGATNPAYVIASAGAADSGSYTVTIVNSCGRQTSADAVVAIDANPRVTSACLTTGAQPRRALAVDLDGSNGEDLVVSTAAGTLEVALNNGASAVVPQPAVTLAPGASGLAAADFDGDGRVDVAVTNRINRDVTVLYGDGAGGFATRFVVAIGGDPIGVAATPVLGHARADLVVADATGRLLVAHNDASATPGARTFAAAGVVATGGSFSDVAAGDVVDSPDAEIIYIDASASVVHVMDATTLAGIAGSPFNCGSAPTALAVLDLNGDGKSEPIVGGSSGVTVLQTPTLEQNAVWSAPVNWVAAGNFDGDGKADLAIVGASGQVVTLHGYNNSGPPDRVEAGSCLLSGTHLARARISRIGLVGNPQLNTDELFVVRSSLNLVCVLRFRLRQAVQSIAGSGCTGYSDASGAIGAPVLGNAGFTLTLNGAHPSTFTMMLMQVNAPSGTPPALYPIGPCQHVLDLLLTFFGGSATTSTAGQAFMAVPIPTATSFVGVELRSQWLTVDPAGAWNGNVTFSTATLFRVGEY